MIFLAATLSILMASMGPVNANGLSYVAFVIDDTGYSMQPHMTAVKAWVQSCVSNPSCGGSPTGGWVLNTFNDPGVGTPYGPANTASLITELSTLVPHQGADCPELAMSGIISAMSVIPKGNSQCKLFMFTDASPKDTHLYADAQAAIMDKECVFIPILTDCCGGCPNPADSINLLGRRRRAISYLPRRNPLLDSIHDFRTSKAAVTSLGKNSKLFYDMAFKSGGSIYLLNRGISATEILKTLKTRVKSIGVCPTRIDGAGIKNNRSCRYAGHCWDESIGRCFQKRKPKPTPTPKTIFSWGSFGKGNIKWW